MLYRIALLIGALALLLSACSSPRGDLGQAAPAEVRVLAASAPAASTLSTQAAGDYLSLTLYVREVAFVGGDAPVVLASYDEPVALDLVALAGLPQELAEAPVPSGDYPGAQLRLVVDHAEITVQNEAGEGVSHEVTVPSGDRSGYKIKLGDLALPPEASVQITLEFDPAASVVETGNGGYLLKPVVSASVTPLE